MRKLLTYFFLAVLLIAPHGVSAQTAEAGQATVATTPTPPPTSREIRFELIFTHLPFGSTQTITLEVWDAATGGNRRKQRADKAVNVKQGHHVQASIGRIERERRGDVAR